MRKFIRRLNAFFTAVVVLAYVAYAIYDQLHVPKPEPPVADELIDRYKSVILTADEAYTYLSSLPAKWAGTSRRDCGTYSPAHIRALDRDFAIRVARMALAWQREQKTPLTVLSAHRSAEEQRCSCDGELGLCKGWRQVERVEGSGLNRRRVTDVIPTGEISKHQSGQAIDLRPGKGSMRDYQTLRQYLENHPEFGLHQPYWSRGDRPHIEAK